jgi:hypothetical protein
MHHGLFTEFFAAQFASDSALVHNKGSIRHPENFLHFAGDEKDRDS